MFFRLRSDLLRYLQPQVAISEQELNTGLSRLTWEGVFSNGFTSIISSGFLAAFALALGASNLQIGLLAAIPPITQILQILAIFLIEKVRRRKAITVISWLLAQLFWFPIAIIPFFVSVPSPLAVSLLLWLMIFRGLLNSISTCAWNSWVFDLVPKKVLGSIFARRAILTTIATVLFGLGGAFFVDYWGDHYTGIAGIQGYSFVILFGALFMGLVSPVILALTPEPIMQRPEVPVSPLRALSSPFMDQNFKWLLAFLFFWSFASNLAIPFFSVYMLQIIGIPVSAVIALYMLSQYFSILFLRVWGPLVDKFSNKAVLSLCASLYLLVILGWCFIMTPDRHSLTIPLLIILHIFAGIASGGVTLTISTIGLKIAPINQSTSYLSCASLCIFIGSGLGPMLGGFLADFFSQRQFIMTFNWTDPLHSMQFSALSITGFSFLFIIAFILGILTLSLLASLREEGEVSREVVLETLLTPMRELSRPVTAVLPYYIAHLPFYRLIRKIPIPGLDIALSVLAYQVGAVAGIILKYIILSLKVLRRVIQMAGIRLGGYIKEKIQS